MRAACCATRAASSSYDGGGSAGTPASFATVDPQPNRRAAMRRGDNYLTSYNRTSVAGSGLYPAYLAESSARLTRRRLLTWLWSGPTGARGRSPGSLVSYERVTMR